ncbi:MAG: Xaa-Pro peptidase family protein [Planctomycetota bacterium]
MESRIDRLRDRLLAEKDSEADAILVTDEVNVRYLSGFTGDSSWLLVQRDGKATLLSDRRYETQIASECPTLNAAVRPPTQKMPELLQEVVTDARLGEVAFEAEHVTVAQLAGWRDLLKDMAWTQTAGWVETLRLVKDASELEIIQRSIDVAQRTFRSVVPKITRRMTERDIAHEFEATMRHLGAEGFSFDAIIAVQPSGALPHYRPADTSLDRCQGLLIDWGASVDGYCSDLTRTLHVADGNLASSDRYRRAYETVLSAQLAAIDCIAGGAKARDVDTAARSVIDAAGLGDAFKHGLGHGFGLQIHESPRMGPLAEETLLPGMVVTVEPGVYFEGEFGIRLEDDVLVTETGCRVLSDLPKGLSDSAVFL